MKILKAIGKMFAVLLCIVYFFGLSSLMIASFATNLLSGDYYAGILRDADLKDIKVSDLGSIFDSSDIDKDTSLEDVLIDSITESGIDKKTATAIVENKEIRNIVGNLIGDYINYQVGGDKPTIDRKDVATVLNNKDVIKALDRKPTEEDIDKIYNELNDLTKDMTRDGGAENGNSERIEKRNINN